jgi:hypothetical protein
MTPRATSTCWPERPVSAGNLERSGVFYLRYLVAELRRRKSRATGGVPAGIEFDQQTISGIATAAPDLAPVTPAQITDGRYFGSGDDAQADAIVGEGYAKREQLTVGEMLTIRGKKFMIVASPGLRSAPTPRTSTCASASCRPCPAAKVG